MGPLRIIAPLAVLFSLAHCSLDWNGLRKPGSGIDAGPNVDVPAMQEDRPRVDVPPSCAPRAETCNGQDDDCDGIQDNGFDCIMSTSSACTTGCGSRGVLACNASCAAMACAPPAESCNGRDDDCDGVCDNGFACCGGAVNPCRTSCGSNGTQSCSAACEPGPVCNPPAEICNGVDDDCDGTLDEGFACVANTSSPCTFTGSACSTTGTQRCGENCAPQTCLAPAEICGNGRDDNCNGQVDGVGEGCSACPAPSSCPGARVISGSGGRFTGTTSGAGSESGSCGGGGAGEAIFTFTTTVESDLFATTHGTGFDTVLYLRRCTCTGAEAACSDDADGFATSVLRQVRLPAGTYTLVVDGKSAGATGPFTLDVFLDPSGAVEGDRCSRPTFWPPTAATQAGSTCALNNDLDGTGCSSPSSGASPDRIFYVVVPATRSVTFSTCAGGAGCTDYDSTLSLRSVCSAPATIACNDDGCSAACTRGALIGKLSRFTQQLTPGIYYLAVDGFNGYCGNYTVSQSGL